MVEQDKKCACVVVNFELCSHWLFNPTDESACQNDVIDGVSLEFADIVGPWLSIHNHPNSYRCENFRLSRLILLVAPLASVASSARSVV